MRFPFVDRMSALWNPSRPREDAAARDALHDLRWDILQAVASYEPLSVITNNLCRRIERIVPNAVCALMTLDADERLRDLAGPGVPDALAGSFDGIKIGPASGSCGAAAFHGRAFEVRDIATDPVWADLKAAPLAAGLRACWSYPVKDGDGRVLGTLGLYHPKARLPESHERPVIETALELCALTLRHHDVWMRLERTNRRFDVALSNLSQGVCFFDRRRRLIVANRRYCEIYGLAPDSVVPGTSLERIVDLRVAAGSGPKMVPAAYLDWRNEVQVSDRPSDTVVELTNGRVIAIHHRPMPDSGWVATHEDITDRTRAEARVVYLASHDGLTGLPNRRLFHERMEQALVPGKHDPGRGPACALLCLDLDRFKTVNDTFGHPAGDALLQGVADRLISCVREIDTVTRLGGDEFAVLQLRPARTEDAAELARRIIGVLNLPFAFDGHSVTAGASIGIAVAPFDGDAAGILMKNADIALYCAKANRRGTFCFFEPGMNDPARYGQPPQAMAAGAQAG